MDWSLTAGTSDRSQVVGIGSRFREGTFLDMRSGWHLDERKHREASLAALSRAGPHLVFASLPAQLPTSAEHVKAVPAFALLLELLAAQAEHGRNLFLDCPEHDAACRAHSAPRRLLSLPGVTSRRICQSALSPV